MMCSTIKLLPAAANAGRQRWNPAKNRGRISSHQANGPPSSPVLTVTGVG